jgi:hypothetical protein
MSILAQPASDDVLDSAYDWLCRRRRDYSANSDIWNFRRCWQREKERIKNELLAEDNPVFVAVEDHPPDRR